MKELVEDFRAIYRNDRRVLFVMGVLLVLGLVLAVLSILNLTPGVAKVWVRYTDINSGYAEGSWWYLLSFLVLGLVMSAGHCLIGARLYGKRGAGVAMMFLIISMGMVLMAISFLLKVLGQM